MQAAEEKTRQANFRIGVDMKRRGDEVLASRNLTPSQGVRLFYDCLARGDEGSEMLLDLIASGEELSEKERERMRKKEALREFDSWAREKHREMGLSLEVEGASDEVPTLDELEQAAYRERFGEVIA